MNILMVSKAMPSSYTGGTQTHVINLSKELVKRGHDVTIVTAHGGLRMPALRMIDGATIAGSPYFPAGIDRFRFHAADELTFNLFVPRTIRRLQKETGKKFDVIHLHGRSGYFCAGNKSLNGIPVITTFHGTVSDEHAAAKKAGGLSVLRRIEMALFRRYAQAVERRSALRADGVIGVSEEMARSIRAMIPGKKIDFTIIPNGINSKEYFKSPGKRIPFRLLIVSRLDSLKGHRFLIEAVAQLRTEYPDISLHIVGDGPQNNDIRETIDRYNLGAAVVMTGVKRGQELLQEYHEADIFVLPSLRETQGIVFMEAMLCGVPVVGFDIPGVNELIENGRTGLLVPKENSGALADAVRALWNDPAGTKKMTETAAETISSKYEWQKVAEKTESYYCSIVNG